MELSMNRSEWKEFEDAYNEMMKPFKKMEPEVPAVYRELRLISDKIDKVRDVLKNKESNKIEKYFARKKYLSLYPKYNNLLDYIVVNKIKNECGHLYEENDCARRYAEDGSIKKYFLNDDGSCSYEEYVEIKL